MAAASGLLVFPLLPVAWEAVSAWRRRREKPTRRFLTRTDRLVLRTLAVALAFVGALLAWGPQRMFVALNSRGDWMLDSHHSPRAESLRRGLFWLAARSEWLYHLTDDNPFHDDGSRPKPRPIPTRVVSRTDDVTPPRGDAPTEALPPPPRDAHAWP